MHVRFLFADVEQLLYSLGVPTHEHALRTILLLEDLGNRLRMPYSKALGNGLFELRIDGTLRIFYTFHNNEAVLLYGFVKKSWRIPSRHLAIAQARKNDLDSV